MGGDAMSDTPRTDAAYFAEGATMYDLAGEAKKMERELNEENGVFGSLSPRSPNVPEVLVHSIMGRASPRRLLV
jgi:hypothetical protein